jgi:hypothetical protein
VAGLIALALTTPGDARPRASAVHRAGHTSQPATRTPLSDDTRTVSVETRAEAIARARVWRAPQHPLDRASLGRRENQPMFECRFTITDLGGTTPKFHCLTDQGEEIRIKYGTGLEIPAETAATRLLRTLGFGADTVTLVERLRCYGCPTAPFMTTKIVEGTHAERLYEHLANPNKYEDFTWVAVERKLDARPIEASDQEGWGFYELDAIDPAKGGASRAEVDALRLMAVFLAHWDNKADNQRLVCLSATWPEGTPCREPFVLLQDVGSTFGPLRVDLDAWQKAMIWQDRASCTISMRDLPYNGATFRAARVSESGRRLLARLLGALSESQVRELFTAARFDHFSGVFEAPRSVDEWVAAFKARVRTITDGAACPEA